jgi:hypothetical protein
MISVCPEQFKAIDEVISIASFTSNKLHSRMQSSFSTELELQNLSR